MKILVSQIDAGDTVILPGDLTPRVVTHTRFNQEKRRWVIQVEAIRRFSDKPVADDVYTYPTGQNIQVELIKRPGYGPFDHDYQIGEAVYYRFGPRDNQFGVVFRVGRDDDSGELVYEIRSATTTGYAGPESMRPADQPAYAVGQRWRSSTSGKAGTITKIEPDSPICVMQMDDGRIIRVVLSAPFWEVI